MRTMFLGFDRLPDADFSPSYSARNGVREGRRSLELPVFARSFAYVYLTDPPFKEFADYGRSGESSPIFHLSDLRSPSCKPSLAIAFITPLTASF